MLGRRTSVHRAFLFGVMGVGFASSGIIVSSWLPAHATSLPAVLIISALAWLILGSQMAAVGSITPRSGGDFSLITLVLGPFLGVASSVFSFVFAGLVGGSLLNMTLEYLLMPVLAPELSAIIGKPQYLNLLSGVLVTAVFVLFSAIQGQKALLRFYGLATVAGCAGWILILFGMILNEPELDTAGASGGALTQAPLTGTAFLIGMWIFFAFFGSTDFAGFDASKSRRYLNLRRATWTAVVTTGFLFWLWQVLGPQPASSLLLASQATPTEEPCCAEALAAPSLAWDTWAGGLPGVAILLTWAVSLLGLGHVYVLYASDILRRWRQEQTLPWWLIGAPQEYRSGQARRIALKQLVLRYGLLVMLVSAGAIHSNYLGSKHVQLPLLPLAVIPLLLTSLSMALLRSRLPSKFNELPLLARRGAGGREVVAPMKTPLPVGERGAFHRLFTALRIVPRSELLAWSAVVYCLYLLLVPLLELQIANSMASRLALLLSALLLIVHRWQQARLKNWDDLVSEDTVSLEAILRTSPKRLGQERRTP